METGTAFLKSKIARRFCLLFIFCAFAPTVTLVVLSYNQVTRQLEEQSLIRLKREAKAYGLALFDRMIRIDNELRAVSQNVQRDPTGHASGPATLGKDLDPLFRGIGIYTATGKIIPVLGTLNPEVLGSLISEEILSNGRPFILTLPQLGDSGRVFFGINVGKRDSPPSSIIGEVKPDYLWGIGASPLLPPMTELAVYDRNGRNIIITEDAPAGDYNELPDQSPSREPGVFQFAENGRRFFTSTANLFIESRFQQTGWIINLSQDRADVMSALDSFKRSFPFGILLFLLLILYLSVSFIRKGLEPLEKLKAGTKRVAMKDFSTKVDITSDDEFGELGKSFNDMTGKIDNQFQALTVLGNIERAILSSFDRSKIISTTLHSFMTFFRCDIVFFVRKSKISEEHAKVYICQGRRNDDARIEYFFLDDGERGKLFVDSDAVFIRNREAQPRFLEKIVDQEFADLLCLPLKVDGTINRVLILGWKEPRQVEEDELRQARQIADQLAIALANSRLLEDMGKLAMGTIEALARTVDAKSKWTAGHSERVAALGCRLAKAMGLSDKQIETIHRGGLLHDIGKIGIPVAILDKPSGLTDKEFAEIKNHPAIGGKILEPIKAYQDILPLVLHHHEKFDGSGYPDRLQGEKIDIRARILAVADVWDALVSDRPYREGWVHERARKIIVDGSGNHFDPRVVEVFLAVMAEA